MKRTFCLIILALVLIACNSSNPVTEKKPNIDENFYTVASSVYLLVSPSDTSNNVIDEINSSDIHKEYCALDSSHLIVIIDTEDKWSKIKVIEPTYLSKTYIGWLPTEKLIKFIPNEAIVAKQSIPNIQYEVVNEKKYETSYKAQLTEYAFYKDSIYTEEVLTDVVMQIYNLNKDKNVFKAHDKATVVGVYLFTSKEAIKDKADWIAMLSKSPNDTEPIVSFNQFKLTALANLSDNIKSEDEIQLEKLKSYLKKRGLDLCTLSDILKKMELDNIHKADAKYPDYGEKHMAMIDRLDAQSYKQLKKKYNLNEDMLSKVSIFAMSYCK
ncbi:MAG: hypothetical protein EOO43_01650 [Flavobacterium sp.]|nr:MAG: hypothetical protein EOO43_01650 [Flavobacterium sp.]